LRSAMMGGVSGKSLSLFVEVLAGLAVF